MKAALKRLAWIIMLAVLLFVQQVTSAELPEAPLKVTPAAIKLSTGEAREARVIVSNPTENPLQRMQLKWFADADVEVCMISPSTDSLPPYGSLAWIIQIRKATIGQAAGNIHFQLDYRHKPKGSSKVVPSIAVGSLEIQDRQPDAMEKVASARIETTLELLQEKRPGSIFLIINNLSNAKITIKRIRIEKPFFIKIEKPEFLKIKKSTLDTQGFVQQLDKNGQIQPMQEVTLAPQESHAFTFTAVASDAVQTGKHMLLFKIDLEQRKHSYAFPETLIATHRFNVGVLGESEILTAIGVPSFLLLPGFLILITFRLLCTHAAPKQPIDLDAKSPEFWTIAILLCGAIVWLYAYVKGRDLLEGYGLNDMWNIWIASIGVGVAGWALIVGTPRLFRRTIMYFYYLYQRARIPSPEDTPVEILRKLARNHRGVALEQVHVQVGNQQQQVLVILPPRQGQTEMWVAPPALVTWKNPADDQEREWLNQLRGQYTAYLNNVNDASAIADFIAREMTNMNLTVVWNESGALKRPTKIQGDHATDVPGVRRLLQDA